MSARRRLRGLQRLRRDDRGAVAVVVSVLMVVFIGLSAFTIDYGYAYAQRRALSSTADGAALAAAEEFRRTRTSSQSCDAMATDNAKAAATAAANLVKTANGPASSTLAVGYSCDGGYLMVTATMSKTTNAFFGGIYGKDSYDVWRTAKAVVAPAGSVTGAFLPFGLCEVDARRVLAGLTPGSDANSAAIKVPLAKTNGTPCGVCLADDTCDGNDEKLSGSGNKSQVQLDPNLTSFGAALTYTGGTKLSIDGSGNVICSLFPSPPAGWCGGYPGAGGNSDPERDAINLLRDTTFMFPVYNRATGDGSNTRYRISGFISAKLCGWQQKNIDSSNAKPKVHKGLCYDDISDQRLGTVNGEGDALQLRAARYVPPAELASCPPAGTPIATGTPCSLTTAGSNYEFVPVIAKLFG